MARLNDCFCLHFHEVDGSIQIEFGDDPVTLSFGEIKEALTIPLTFEESTSRIPVKIADKEEIEALFSDIVIVGGGPGPGPHDYYTRAQTDELLSHKVDKEEGKGLSTNDLTDELVEMIYAAAPIQVVYIFTDRGIFTQEKIDILHQNYANYIDYNGIFYKLGYKRGNLFRYYAQNASTTDQWWCEVDMETGAWEIGVFVDPHPLDQVRHITAEERTFWNNKLNCIDAVQEERLILNRN